MENYYSILGLPENASEDDIRKAYRMLAKQFHPDINKAPDAHVRFILINKAYEVLMDRRQRIIYDQKSKTAEDPFKRYADWVQQQHARQQEEARRKHMEFLRKKKQLKESKLYYPYMIALYVSTITLVSLCLIVLVACAVVIFRYHVFMFFFLLPFICVAAYVLKVTLDEYRKYRALFV
ncbi:MAG TPA: DnaJ domain-containing protein [Cytophagaceae bacterium]|nr:DnaJ domain-containing protein [Cytophagaceae bacterium]